MSGKNCKSKSTNFHYFVGDPYQGNIILLGLITNGWQYYTDK
jgi:hypothetical protein